AGHALIKETKAFALNVLGKGQQALAFTFFKPAEKKGDTISGEPFRPGKTGAPILASTPAFIECSLESTVEMGDHSIFVGKVVEVGQAKTIDGRPDDATLWMKDLGDKVFYGGEASGTRVPLGARPFGPRLLPRSDEGRIVAQPAEPLESR